MRVAESRRMTGTRPRSRKRWTRRYLPPQHGAWAMLLVPFIVGVVLAGPAWVHLPLLVAWLTGYLLSYYVFMAVKTRRIGRVRDQVLLYTAITVPSVILAVLMAPRLLYFAPAFAVLFAANTWFAWRKQERAVFNDLVSVVQGCLMVPVAAVAAGATVESVVPAFVAVLLYFIGTVLFVKTMIRERGEVAYLRASIAFHVVAAIVSALIHWSLAVFFGWLLVRSVSFPRHKMSPLRLGVIEIVNSVVLVVLLAVVG
ncbi:MAG: YwiC-like family protein [Jiangellaceae bacterium]